MKTDGNYLDWGTWLPSAHPVTRMKLISVSLIQSFYLREVSLAVSIYPETAATLFHRWKCTCLLKDGFSEQQSQLGLYFLRWGRAGTQQRRLVIIPLQSKSNDINHAPSIAVLLHAISYPSIFQILLHICTARIVKLKTVETGCIQPAPVFVAG